MIDWSFLSKYSNNIYFLNENLDKIDWKSLSCNIYAIEILEKHIDNINWFNLSSNINAMSILINNQDKIVIAPQNWFGPQNKFIETDIIPSNWIKI